MIINGDLKPEDWMIRNEEEYFSHMNEEHGIKFVHVNPNSEFFTDLHQILETLKYTDRYISVEEMAQDLTLKIKNTIKNGLNISKYD